MVLFEGKSAVDTTGYLDDDQVRRGQELGIYVAFSAGTTGGTVVVEGAHKSGYAGDWALLETVAWKAAGTVRFAALTGVHGAVRVRISEVILNGTVDAHWFGD